MTAIKNRIRDVISDLDISHEKIEKVKCLLTKELKKGLRKETNPDADVKMFPTYVRDLPNGKESGRFLALDLGGTNFRVLLIEFDEGKVHMESKIYTLPQQIMLGTGEQLFDHIAECLAQFMKECDLMNEILPLGFTFSFPCRQEGLTKATLVQWTKGFDCSGVVGEDVVQLLRDALERRSDVNIDVVALVNDTTGTLMSCAYKEPTCMIGAIVGLHCFLAEGTGTNACYMESLENVELWNSDRNEPTQVIINCEWGAFGDNGVLDFVRTEQDRIIDASSLNVGRQIYEKMISGMYMGEIVRLTLVKLVRADLLFGGFLSESLQEQNRFFTKYISEIEEDEGLSSTKFVLEELGIFDPSDDDCESVKYLCKVVSTRAANLTAAGLTSLLLKVNKPHVMVGIDGSVYRFHPHFHERLVRKIRELLPANLKFDVMLSEDGSGKGAALVAAVVVRRRNLQSV